MKVLKIIGVILLILIAGVFIWYLTLPDTAHMERSVIVNKDVNTVYNDLTSYDNFNAWSPWAERDPNAKYTYEGPQRGVGAKINWESEESDVGVGSMWIVAAEPNKRISQRMSFDGFPGEPTANFLLEEVAGGTKVTWTYDEKGLSGSGKLIGAMMDSFLGADYENGLNNYKSYIESKEDIMEDTDDMNEDLEDEAEDMVDMNEDDD